MEKYKNLLHFNIFDNKLSFVEGFENEDVPARYIRIERQIPANWVQPDVHWNPEHGGGLAWWKIELLSGDNKILDGYSSTNDSSNKWMLRKQNEGDIILKTSGTVHNQDTNYGVAFSVPDEVKYDENKISYFGESGIAGVYSGSLPGEDGNTWVEFKLPERMSNLNVVIHKWKNDNLRDYYSGVSVKLLMDSINFGDDADNVVKTMEPTYYTPLTTTQATTTQATTTQATTTQATTTQATTTQARDCGIDDVKYVGGGFSTMDESIAACGSGYTVASPEQVLHSTEHCGLNTYAYGKMSNDKYSVPIWRNQKPWHNVVGGNQGQFCSKISTPTTTQAATTQAATTQATADIAYIEVKAKPNDWLNLNQIEALDSNGNKINPSTSLKGYGAEFIMNNTTHHGAGTNGNTYVSQAERLIDGNYDELAHANATGDFVRIYYDKNKLATVSTIKIYNRWDSCVYCRDRIKGGRIRVFLGSFPLVYDQPIQSGNRIISFETATTTTQASTTRPATTLLATTQVATTQAATTQAATTQAATTLPATTRPATTQAATTRPATTQAATTQAATTQAATTRPATTQPTTRKPTSAELKSMVQEFEKTIRELDKMENIIPSNLVEQKKKDEAVKELQIKLDKMEQQLEGIVYLDEKQKEKKRLEIEKRNRKIRQKDIENRIKEREILNEKIMGQRKMQEMDAKNEAERMKKMQNVKSKYDKTEKERVKAIRALENSIERPFLTRSDRDVMHKTSHDIQCNCRPCRKCAKQKTITNFNITDHPDIVHYMLRSLKCPPRKVKNNLNYSSTSLSNVSLYESVNDTNAGSLVPLDDSILF